MRTIIIPAGGSAVRFGGTLKELLPITAKGTPFLHALYNARYRYYADTIIVISNPKKIQEHSHYLAEHCEFAQDVQLRLTVDPTNVWKAIQAVLPDEASGICLADTITDAVTVQHTKDINFGIFKTHEPERFSIFDTNRIITKPQNYPAPAYAWGTVAWSQEVSMYLKSQMFTHYDEAFNAVIQNFSYGVHILPYYYDIGTFEAYRAFFQERYGYGTSKSNRNTHEL